MDPRSVGVDESFRNGRFTRAMRGVSSSPARKFVRRRDRPDREPRRDRGGLLPRAALPARREDGAASARAIRAAGPRSAPTDANESGAIGDDYAATGMGQRDRHEVESVDIDLDPHPVASARVRYEFRSQLVGKLGVVLDASPLQRRERARGFGGFCPQP